MKKLKKWQHEKEFDTQTIITDIGSEAIEAAANVGNTEDTAADNNPSASSSAKFAGKNNTEKAVNLKALTKMQQKDATDKQTRTYTPRPLTPDDDIYEDILEQFASTPTKPKYWFEEFGDYWSCSCGHINKGDICKSCGLERSLLRSLFILHKPADEPGKLNKKLKQAKDQIDKEESLQEEKQRKQKNANTDIDNIKPIKASEQTEVEQSNEAANRDIYPEANQIVKQNDVKAVSTNHEDKGTDGSKRKYETFEFKPKKPAKKTIIIISAIVLLVLLIVGGALAYTHFAAPALQYDQAQQLQADGKYEKAITKYEALGNYKDSKRMIWKCHIGIGDAHYTNGEFEAAIEAYNTAMKLKESNNIQEKIRKCHIGIGDRHFDNNEFEAAISSYNTAGDIKNSDALQEKINKAKFGYVNAYQSKRTAQAEQYLSQLMELNYPGIKEIYDSYYAWHVKIIANTSEDDFSTDIDTVSRNDTVYFHAILSGGEPDEQIELYYEVIWPNGSSQLYDLESKWKSGSNITARFQYPVPIFGKEGKLTFKLYDRSTNQVLSTDAVTLQK